MGCPQVGRGGVFRQITSNWFQICSSHIALYRSCMNEVKSALAKVLAGFVHKTVGHCKSCVHISFCPITLQVLNLFNTRMVQADSCLNSEQIDTLLISVGGQEGVFGGRGILGRRPQKCTWVSGILFIVPWRPLFCACRRYQWQKMADLSKWDKYQGHRLHRVYHPHHCLAARRTEKCKRQQPGGKWLAY